MLKSGQVVIGDGADRVLKLRASHAHVDQLRPHGFELGLGLGHIHPRGHSAFEAPLGQIELVLQIGNRRLEEFDLRIEAAQLEVVRRQFRLQRQSSKLAMSAALACAVARAGLDVAPDATPEIRLPSGLSRPESDRCNWSCVVDVTSGRFCESLSGASMLTAPARG